MSLTVKIPVVERKRPLITRVSTYGCMAICIIFFVTIIYDTSKMLVMVSLFLVIVSGLIMLLSKKYLIEGYLILSSEDILIKTKTLEQNISVKDLTKLKFTYNGTDGNSYTLNPHSLSRKDGTDNYIVLQNKNNEKYNFELLLNRNNLIPLSKILNDWRKINPKFETNG